jgi:hypothetical protein
MHSRSYDNKHNKNHIPARDNPGRIYQVAADPTRRQKIETDSTKWSISTGALSSRRFSN